ncbi:MAG: hypothetical protein E7J62_24720 [Serratia marcescens]|uniref:Uncharacterized protein n=1 Tax=Mixta calida TaxID=665913 RepID=A0ABM6RZK2_9GAMM|nr:hypothetical protein [Mixta calida]MBS6058179.1 hypothetical protein [Pantoea sp.]MDU7807815.1 hypothetical protein [Serratia marcescens]AUY24532.1 hypothetical protein C2E16_06125 [Mixta calida]KAF0860880.1 hypothetical protein Y888_04015 [Mixta calida B021323]MDU4940340.1 hypothetical protein [Mixta calida]
MAPNEMLNDFIKGNGYGVAPSAVVEMARELLALRKAFSEPAVHEAEINGVMSSVTKSQYQDCKKYGVPTRLLYTKPTEIT